MLEYVLEHVFDVVSRSTRCLEVGHRGSCGVQVPGKRFRLCSGHLQQTPKKRQSRDVRVDNVIDGKEKSDKPSFGAHPEKPERAHE